MDEPVTPPPSAALPAGATGAPLQVTPPSRRARMRWPLGTAGVVGGLTLALHFRDPHTSGSWGFCPWLALTGYYCSGCGGLRAVNDLTNGDIVGAASSNLIFVLMVPVLVVWWLRWTQRSWVGTEGTTLTRQLSTVLITVFAVAVVAFGVLRNLPGGSWLAP